MAVLDRHISASESVVCAELDGEAVLLNVDTGTYFGLDVVATSIWNILTRGATQQQIVDQLLGEFDVEAAQLEADVAEFLELLATNGLARVSTP